jgi:hypothetical protein
MYFNYVFIYKIMKNVINNNKTLYYYVLKIVIVWLKASPDTASSLVK